MICIARVYSRLIIMENIFCRKSTKKKKSFKNLFTYGQSPIGFGYAIITEILIYEVYL